MQVNSIVDVDTSWGQVDHRRILGGGGEGPFTIADQINVSTAKL